MKWYIAAVETKLLTDMQTVDNLLARLMSDICHKYLCYTRWKWLTLGKSFLMYTSLWWHNHDKIRYTSDKPSVEAGVKRLWSELCYYILLRFIVEYRQVSNIWRTLAGYKIVDHSDIVGASPVGAAPTTSSFSTKHLAPLDWAKTAARRDEKQLSLGIWCVLY